MGRSRALSSALLFFSFALLAVVQSWPLPLSLSTSLTGQAGGDTGVYVWNIWVFRHELLLGRSPLSTAMIFAPGDPSDLSLHNYTIAANLMAWPLLAFLKAVTAFNVIYLFNVTLAGLGAYALSKRLWLTNPVSPGAAWLGGFLFACSPFLVARSTAHFSLVAAASLPFFVVCLDRAWHSNRLRDAAGVGACVAWAAYSDPYYAVYCVLLGIAVIGMHVARIESSLQPHRSGLSTRLLDIAIGTGAIVVGVISMMPSDSITIGGLTISVRSLYTPVLVLSVLVFIRACLTFRPRIVWKARLPEKWALTSATAIAVAVVLLLPMLVALGARISSGEFNSAPVFWRSSAPGVDLVSFFVPNPTHALAPRALVDWISREPGHFEENVVAIPWTALVIIAAARVITGRWTSRFWLFVTLASAMLTLGPFIRIAGVETYVPTPWALLRYVPLIGEARMPPRFGVIVILGVAVLFAGAIESLRRRYPEKRRLLTFATLAVLSVELLPVPRMLYPATFPGVYETIKNDGRPGTVLDLPVGFLDGLSALGKYSAISQFYQTEHGKPIVGGYLSRVTDARKEYFVRRPFLAALVAASAGTPIAPADRTAALEDAVPFATEASVRYVVVDEGRTAPELRELAIAALDLREVGRDSGLVLYVPAFWDAAGVSSEGRGEPPR